MPSAVHVPGAEQKKVPERAAQIPEVLFDSQACQGGVLAVLMEKGDQANLDIGELSKIKTTFEPRDIMEFYYLRGYTERTESLDPNWWQANTATRSTAKAKAVKKARAAPPPSRAETRSPSDLE